MVVATDHSDAARLFEGRVHGTGFACSKLPNLNYDNHQLIHVSDWLPTIRYSRVRAWQ